MFLFWIVGRKNALVSSHQIVLEVIPLLASFFYDFFSLFALEYISLSRLQPDFSDFFCSLEIFAFILLRDSHQFKRIFNEVLLDKIVERSASLKTWSVVDFDDDGFKIISHHDIKTQYMEAHASFILFGLAILVLMADAGQSTDD